MRKNPRWLWATVAASSAAFGTCAKAQDIDPRSGLPAQAGYSAGTGGGTMPFAPPGSYGAYAATPGEYAAPVAPGNPYEEGSGYLYPKFFPRVNVGHFLGQGFGYRRNFTTASVWMPLQIGDPNQLAFADLRGILDNHARLGANIGMGYRQFNPDARRIVGLYGYYDYRDSGAQRYSQLSGGAEILTACFDYRLNFYVPFRDSTTITSDTYDCLSPRAEGNFLFITRRIGKEVAYKGGDAEIGFPLLARIIPGGKAHLGGYYYQASEAKKAYGVRGRVEAQINTWTHLQGVWQTDQVFGNTAFGGVTFSWPGVKRNVIEGQDEMQARLAEPVYRQQNIALFNSVQTSEEAAADPVTRQPIRIVYLDGDAAAAGDGSLAAPFNTLDGAEAASLAGDLIFVRGGTFTGGDGIVLKDNQRLIGNGGSPIGGKASAAPTVQIAQCPGVGVALPGVSLDPNDRPIITGVVGNAITLANNNEVGSLRILNTFGSGIVGTGIQSFNIHDVSVTGSTGPGVQLTNVFGQGTVARSEFDNNGAGGFIVTNSAGNSLSLALTCNHFNNNNGTFLTGHGLGVTAFGGSISVVSDTNQFNDNVGSGMSLITGADPANPGTTGAITVASLRDQFNRNEVHGASLQATSGTLTATFDQAQFIANARPVPPPFVPPPPPPPILPVVPNNTPANGLFVNVGSAGNATANVTVTNSELTANEANGFELRMDGVGSSSTVSLQGSRFTQNGLHGAFIRVQNGTLDLTATGNVFTGNAANGLAMQGFGSSNGSVAITNNDILSNGIGPATVIDPLTGQLFLNGLYFALQGGAGGGGFVVDVNNNRIHDNGFGGVGDGIHIVVSPQAALAGTINNTVNITNNTILRNQNDGVRFFELGGSVPNQTLANINTNDINNNGLHGIEFTLRQLALGTFLIDNNGIARNGGSGIEGLVQAQGLTESAGLAIRVQRNNITLNGATGVIGPIGLTTTAGVNLTINGTPTQAFANLGQPAGVNLININDNVEISGNQTGIQIVTTARTATSITNHRNATNDQPRIFGNARGGIVVVHAIGGAATQADPVNGGLMSGSAGTVHDLRISRNVIDATPTGGGANSGTEAIVLGVAGAGSMRALVTANVLQGNGYTATLSPFIIPVGTLVAPERANATANARFLAVSGAFGAGNTAIMRLRLEEANVNDLQYNLVLLAPVSGPPLFLDEFDINSTAATNFGRANPLLTPFFVGQNGVYGFSAFALSGVTGNDFSAADQPNPIIRVVPPNGITPAFFPPAP